MFDHQAAVLNDFNPAAREFLSDGVVSDAGLKPDRGGFFREYVFDVRIDVVRAAKDVDQIHLSRNIA